ncbi:MULTISPECIES: GNAT family N-acetyltransferase [Microbacterium]|uniref:GNAT family N-acetyltransferase n=1 Tax=Microbacterium TaxID=33882 RepID=UPI000D988037|nr:MULTISPECIES: GNAT family N-acetyltransferase [Microbacterium]QYG12300.1 GNAT family N-acetyltransferase [Microbacterium sp. PAMC22086]
MSNIRIRDVDPRDVAELLRWNGILRDGYSAGRQKVWSRSDEATRLQFQSPHPTRRSVLLLAEIDEVPVGAAEAHVHPGEPADVEIAVLDAFRHRGVARALVHAIRNALRGTATMMRTETYSDAGVSFARSEGLQVGVRESRQVVDLPVSTKTLDRLPTALADVDIVSWVGACPDELLDDWARLRAHMSEDVPMGDLTRTPAPADVAAVRRNEERMSEQGYALVRSVARADGEAVGYTEILLSRPDPKIVLQDDTFVAQRVRGRGIGRALKVANLRRLMSLPESSDSRFLQTYTALTNAPMLALNRSVGFEEVDVLTILEGPLG